MPLLAAAALVLSGCGAAQHRAEVQDDGIDRVSVGTVQREIKVGMPSAEVDRFALLTLAEGRVEWLELRPQPEGVSLVDLVIEERRSGW